MKTSRYRFLLHSLWILLMTLTLETIPLTAQAVSPDWNVTVLNQLLAAVKPGQSFVQIGDMLISVSYLQQWRDKLAGEPQPNLAFSGTFTQWPNGDVYYAFDASVSASDQRAFLDAAATWATFANLHFIARSTQADYILVTNNPTLGGGLSYVGMVGGPQLLQIGPNAWNRHTLCHEIGHALGLVHEIGQPAALVFPIGRGGEAVIDHDQERALAGDGPARVDQGMGQRQDHQGGDRQAQQQQPPGRAMRCLLGRGQAEQETDGRKIQTPRRRRHQPQQPPQHRQQQQGAQNPGCGEGEAAEAQHAGPIIAASSR